MVQKTVNGYVDCANTADVPKRRDDKAGHRRSLHAHPWRRLYFKSAPTRGQLHDKALRNAPPAQVAAKSRGLRPCGHSSSVETESATIRRRGERRSQEQDIYSRRATPEVTTSETQALHSTGIVSRALHNPRKIAVLILISGIHRRTTSGRDLHISTSQQCATKQPAPHAVSGSHGPFPESVASSPSRRIV